ncbi:MAG: hypothetical protein HYZ53_05105 [Planctomycetes bacterium]|nr:hypothetical protein [Planctomycetota bacterium]
MSQEPGSPPPSASAAAAPAAAPVSLASPASPTPADIHDLPAGRKRLFIALTLGFFFVLIAALSYALHLKLRPPRVWRTVHSSNAGPFYALDPVLGWTLSPGHFELDVLSDAGGPAVHFACTHDEHGRRVTSADPSRFDGMPQVWICGCSFTCGWLLNDDQTYPWQAQERLPAFEVLNLGVNGYGNVQAVLQLQEAVEARVVLPRVAAFSYCSFHPVRNVVAPSWRARFLPNPAFRVFEHLQVARATLDAEARLQLDFVPAFGGTEGADPPESLQVRVTQAVFDRLLTLCRAHGIAALLGVQFAPSDDPVVAHCRAAGFTVVDMQVDYRKPEFRVVEWDPHPNAASARIFAERLAAAVRALR